jgi:flagellar hook assembly protein FlgD
MAVRLSLFDASGRRVRTLAEGSWSAGEHSVRWDLSNDDGRPLSAGLYFALLEVEGRLLGQRIVATR